jgi:hypothetical protein
MLLSPTIRLHAGPAGILLLFQTSPPYTFFEQTSLLHVQQFSLWNLPNILKLFASNKAVAIRRYREFVKKGIEQGKRSDLVGGGLIRSAGGWSAIKALRRIGAYQKGDERILGDSDFVKKVLAQALVNFFKLRP